MEPSKNFIIHFNILTVICKQIKIRRLLLKALKIKQNNVVIADKLSNTLAIGQINYIMNIIWTVITILALLGLTLSNPQSVLTVCLDSSSQALKTALELTAVYCVWLGIFKIAEECHLVEKLSKLLRPLNKKLYGNISEVAQGYVSLNLASNMLGVGNASTPSAISAIRETEHGERLSRFGVMLFVVNATSVQLLPTTVIGIRSSLGSADPSDVILPNLVATVITSVVGIFLVFVAYGKADKNKSKSTASSELNGLLP